MSWQPILDGELADQARAAIADIARDLACGAGERRVPSDLALFWAYFAGALDEPWVGAALDEATVELCRALADPCDIHLHNGLAGRAWVLAHITEEGAADDALLTVDDTLADALAVDTWRGHYDLVGGLVGVGVYALERGSPRLARRVVDHLAALAVADRDGLTWFTPPELLAPGQLSGWPEGCFNCGLAHGVPGVVALLGRIAEAQLDPRAHELCTRGLTWLHARRSPDPCGSFAAAVVRGRDGALAPSGTRRAAWCYGDPGVVTAMWSASLRCDVPFDEDLARRVATRAPELSGVEDAALCHGAIGLAHMFNRWFQASRDPILLGAARNWFERGLAKRTFADGDGVGGFAARGRPGGAPAWSPAADLIEGASGIALGLLAATGDVEPAWDRLLLCDFPTARRVDRLTS